MFFVLDIAKDVFTATINGYLAAHLFCNAKIPKGKGIGLFDL